jgi:hypothetical protein
MPDSSYPFDGGEPLLHLDLESLEVRGHDILKWLAYIIDHAHGFSPTGNDRTSSALSHTISRPQLRAEGLP